MDRMSRPKGEGRYNKQRNDLKLFEISAEMPIRKPNRLKVNAVSTRKVSIQNGCAI